MKIDNWKIFPSPILAVYLKDFFCQWGQTLWIIILWIGNYVHCCFYNHDSTRFSILRVSANALYDCYWGIVDSFIFIYFHSLIKLAFLVSKGLLCLHDKQNRVYMIKSYSTRHLTRSLRLLVSYRVQQSKRNSISTRAHVSFSIHKLICSSVVTIRFDMCFKHICVVNFFKYAHVHMI